MNVNIVEAMGSVRLVSEKLRKAEGGAEHQKGRGVRERKQPREGRLDQLGARLASHGGGANPKCCAAWVGPDQLGPDDNRALTLAWRQPLVFQRLPLDHNSQGLAPTTSLPDLASPPALRAVSGPRRIGRREL